MKAFPIVCLLLLLPLSSFSQKNRQREMTSYVNPFVGTGAHGHTFPGATLPFGMVQLSPDTRLTGWDGCSGYHYSDHIIYGFSHTHLSGTGIPDYGGLRAYHEAVRSSPSAPWSFERFAAEIFRRRVTELDVRPHRAVEDQHAVGESVEI